MRYEETPERVFLAGGILGATDGDTDKRLRARHECASSRARFAWMRFDVCASRSGGSLPGNLTKVRSAADADAMVRAFNGVAQINLRESFIVLALDSRNQPLGFAVVAEGGVSFAAVDRSLVFKAAVLLPAPSIILVHNHPSGELSPSEDDIRITEQIVEGGKLLGVRVLDHIIMTERGYYSFLEAGRMPR